MPRSRVLTRIEPFGSAPLADVLAARLGDPLWMLARQWQLGELLGEDGGTPVATELQLTIHSLTHITAHPTAGWPVDMEKERLDPSMPLEAVVEATAQPTPWPLWQRADTGRRFAQMAQAASRPDLAAAAANAFPLQPAAADDGEGAVLHRLLQSLPDGGLLFAALHGTDLSLADVTLPAPFDAAIEQHEVRDLLNRWRSWSAQVLPMGSGALAWQPDELTHRFHVAAASSTGTEVFAADHPGGPIDWYRFTHIHSGDPLPMAPEPQGRTVRLTPTLLRYPGMPAERWWQTDDNIIDLGAVDAGSADLARLFVLDYALSYGGDAYLIPVRLPAGSWTTVEKLDVLDTFGAQTTIHPARAPDWALFTVGSKPGLLLTPSALGQLTGEAVDEITLARDEPANLAWLIEDRWEGGTGRPVGRRSPTATPAQPSDQTVDLVWRLVDNPPPQWIPMLPEDEPASGPTLRRLHLADRPARSTLTSTIAVRLPDRTIPQSGLRVRRRYQLANASNGRPVHWISAQTDTARQQGAAGLRWDNVEHHQTVT